MNDSTPGDSIFLAAVLISYGSLAQKSGFSNQYHSAMDIGPQMCARYSLTKEQITMLIGEIEGDHQHRRALQHRPHRKQRLKS